MYIGNSSVVYVFVWMALLWDLILYTSILTFCGDKGDYFLRVLMFEILQIGIKTQKFVHANKSFTSL